MAKRKPSPLALVNPCNRCGAFAGQWHNPGCPGPVTVIAKPAECICPGDEPICPRCGRRWEWMRQWKDGKITYTSDIVVQKYLALYGAPEIPFERVVHSEVK
jgi:hypothetical protein